MEEINKNSIDELLIRYLTGVASNDELLEAENWLNANEENRAYFNQFKSVYEMSSNLKEYQEIDTESSLKNVKNRIDFVPPGKVKVRPLFIVMRIAAVLIIALGLFFIFKDDGGTMIERQMVKAESFDDLKTISLPDGSVVTLNKLSTIEYDEKFGGDERRVKFVGEAYFEIAPNKTKPFIIETDKSETRVVGTAFNLKAVIGRETESIVVTEGIVKFSGKTEKTVKPVRLVKGDKAVINSELVKEKNTDLNFMAWKTGFLLFEDKSLPEALRQMSEFYDCNFKIQDTVLSNYTLNGRYDKNMKTDDLLEVLEMTLGLTVEKEGKTYWLKKKTD